MAGEGSTPSTIWTSPVLVAVALLFGAGGGGLGLGTTLSGATASSASGVMTVTIDEKTIAEIRNGQASKLILERIEAQIAQIGLQLAKNADANAELRLLINSMDSEISQNSKEIEKFGGQLRDYDTRVRNLERSAIGPPLGPTP